MNKMKIIILVLLLFFSLYIGRTMRNDWYIKPSFQPPNWVFPVVWTFLYTSLIYIYYVNPTNEVFYLISISFILQTLWLKKFNPENLQTSKIFIVLISLVALLLFIKIEKLKILAFLYLFWVSYATLLNFNIKIKEY